jgi:Trk K+ transport system NAD-binding subunit
VAKDPKPSLRRFARDPEPSPSRTAKDPEPSQTPTDSPGHLIVCGDDALAMRIVEELTLRYDEEVTVILPSARRERGPMIARLPRVRLVERAELDTQAFLTAGLRTARAVALVKQDDLSNIHAALRAQEINEDIRIVIASFNPGLGDRIAGFFTDCLVLSESGLAAPSFVAAALDEHEPSQVVVADRTLQLAVRDEADPGRVICGVSSDPDGGSLRLEPQEGGSELVLAVADARPRLQPGWPLTDQLRVTTRKLRALFWNRMGIATAVMVAIIVIGFVLVRIVPHNWSDTFYLTALDSTGDAVTMPSLSAPEKFAQFLLTADSLAIIPLATALIVTSRLPASGRVGRRVRNHVILAGLGNVGTQVLRQLRELRVDVVCVDKDENADGMPLARRHGVKVVIGETHREETLQDAGIATCRAVISVTSDDTVNLETALLARALADAPRIVLRLYDNDLARQIDKHVGNTRSRSVSYLAAPQFAAAMLEHEVLRTIPVGRHVLLIAKVTVGSGAELAGARVADVHDGSGNVRLIALQRGGEAAADWSPSRDAEIAAGDILFVLATRAGLGWVRASSRPQ